MSMVVWGGSAPKGESAWGGSDDSGAGIYLQAGNAPLVALLSSTADGTQGAMQYKAIPIFNWAGFLEPSDREKFFFMKQSLMFCAETTVVSGICKVGFVAQMACVRRVHTQTYSHDDKHAHPHTHIHTYTPGLVRGRAGAALPVSGPASPAGGAG